MRPLSVKVKFCGITRLEDAETAAALGADAVGFVFYEKSPRFIDPAAAAEIIRRLPPFVCKVGLFVNSEKHKVESVVRETGIDLVQYHGDESPVIPKDIAARVRRSISRLRIMCSML